MKQIHLIAIIALLCANTFAQTPDSSGIQTETDSVRPKSTLTLGVSYSNNANFYGQRAAESMPYVLAAASWRHRSGFYVSGMGYKLLNYDSDGLVSASSLGAGISFPMGKKVSGDINFNHTFYPAGSPFLQAANENNAGASFTLENWLSTTANVDYAFGKTRDVFVSLATAKFINLGSIFSPNDFVSLTPAVEVVAGTQHYYQTYLTEKRIRDSIAGIPVPPLLGNNEEAETLYTKKNTRFDLLSYNFKFPLAYNRAAYQLEVMYHLSLLSQHTASFSGQTNSFLTASFYYQF